MNKKGMIMVLKNYYVSSIRKASSFTFFAAALVATAMVLPQDALAHLLQGNKGPVNAYNYTETLLQHLNSDCTYSFECQHNDVKNDFLYNCYYDVQSSECQCSKGAFSKCDASKSSLDAATAARLKGANASAAFPLALVSGLAKPVKSLVGLIVSLPLAGKIAAGVLVLIAVIALFMRLRDTLNNNIRKARALHDEATALHEQGQEEEAKQLFEKANYYREHAYEQQQSRT